MVRVIILFLIIAFTPAQCLSFGLFPSQHCQDATSAAPTGTTYYGYPQTAGVPNDPTGSATGYGTAGTYKVYTREDTAGASPGTITHINIYKGSYTWTALTNLYGCVYNGSSLVGQTADLGGDDIISSWTGNIAVSEVSSGSLVYASGDTLRFGVCAKTVGANMLAQDS